MTFPYERDVEPMVVNSFMEGLGVNRLYMRERPALSGDVKLWHYELDLLDDEWEGSYHPQIANFQVTRHPSETRWHQRQEAWFNVLHDRLEAPKILPKNIPYHREYQLLDYIARHVEQNGYPRASTALVAYLYGTHVYARRNVTRERWRKGNLIYQYAALANESRLRPGQMVEIAERGWDLPEAMGYVQSGAHFGMLRDLLPDAPNR